MAALEAVLFDYGDTLFRFRYDERTHAAALAGLLDELGRADVSADALFVEFDQRLGPGLDARGEHGELDYLALVRDALAAVGVVVDEQALLRAMRVEHRGWDRNRELHPDSLQLLAAVRERGLRVGMVSNVFDIPELMHEDLALMGLTDLIDAAVFSSELGVRKPHPAVYLHVLELLGVAPAAALFVGDRVREDVAGPAALGMRTCLARYYRNDGGDQRLADYRIDAPLELLPICDQLLAARG